MSMSTSSSDRLQADKMHRRKLAQTQRGGDPNAESHLSGLCIYSFDKKSKEADAAAGTGEKTNTDDSRWREIKFKHFDTGSPNYDDAPARPYLTGSREGKKYRRTRATTVFVSANWCTADAPGVSGLNPFQCRPQTPPSPPTSSISSSKRKTRERESEREKLSVIKQMSIAVSVPAQHREEEEAAEGK